jgi:hypothetical protein
MDSTEGATTSVRDTAGERKALPAILIVLAMALLVLPAAASAQQFKPATNDNYLESSSFNQPGTRLNRTESLIDRIVTTGATVQADMFSPPNSGGPAEPTTCDGASYGKTVWYDFYPDVTGVAVLEASGYNTALTVMPFNRATAVPSLSRAQCVNESAGGKEEFLVQVVRGRAYTIQVGGVNDASGNLEFEFNFFADPDVDGVVGNSDNCPRIKGSERNKGCPLRLRAETTLRALPTAGGIELDRLTVSVNRKARIAVRCRGCPQQVKRGRSARFPALAGRELPAGSKLEIRVTRRGAFGAYTAYQIVRGNFKKITRCMNPGSRKLRRKCG